MVVNTPPTEDVSSPPETNVFEAPRKIWLEYVRSSLEKRSEPWGGANEVHLPNKAVSSIH